MSALISRFGREVGRSRKRAGDPLIGLRCTTYIPSHAPNDPSRSQLAPHTAYRMGIIHFRSLYSLLRLLPAYRLFRRLRRANSGLRLGLKLWAPEGYPSGPDGLREAWEVMEQDLIGLDVGLEALVPNEEVEPDEGIQRYNFPSLDLFGNEYNLSVDYRPEVDFHIDDLESVLSEKFVDMDEDWFTPTMARHRMEGTSAPTSNSSTNPPSRRVATPTAIPSSSSSNPAPIPQRQGPASIGSFQSGVVPGSKSRQPSSQKSPDPSVTERWSALGQGLPFAAGSTAAPDMRVSLLSRGDELQVLTSGSTRLRLQLLELPSQLVGCPVTPYTHSLPPHHPHRIFGRRQRGYLKVPVRRWHRGLVSPTPARSDVPVHSFRSPGAHSPTPNWPTCTLVRHRHPSPEPCLETIYPWDLLLTIRNLPSHPRV